MKFTSLWQAALFVLVAVTAVAGPRVALMNFSTDDNSYRSAQAAIDFTGLVQARIGDTNVEWVERAELSRIQDELKLSTMERITGDSLWRQGKLAGADWAVTGQFSLDDRNQRTLRLEIIDLRHADSLATRLVTFTNQSMVQIQPAEESVDFTIQALRDLLVEAGLRGQGGTDKILVAPLFFADISGFGGRPNQTLLEPAFQKALERAVATHDQVRLARFPKAYRSTQESEMVFDGLVAANPDDWQPTADVYVWGTYEINRKTRPGHVTPALKITLHTWDGVLPPATNQAEVPSSFIGEVSPDRLDAVLNRLASQVVAQARKHALQPAPENLRRQVAASLVRTYQQMSSHGPPLGLDGQENFLEAVHMLEMACFFDPGNADARALYITCRWGWWMDFNFNVKNEFWSKWRRSEAWGRYVDRFGLQPVAVELPFPYQQQGGVAAAYVRSLQDALELFPQWNSPDEMAMEDQWQKQGADTPLMEAERHGFPTEMPRELAMKWKTEAAAELAIRKARVADFVKSNPPPPVVPRKPAGMSPPVFHRPARPAAVMVPAPSWSRDFQSFFSLFRLFPPSVLPVQIESTPREISFPSQFEVKKVEQLAMLDDQLLIRATDERSQPSSDVNPEAATEMLLKQSRLWLLKPNENRPTLYDSSLFSQNVNAFRLHDGRLWVAGDSGGCLDLKTHEFRKMNQADGFDLSAVKVFGGAGGHLFAAGSELNQLQRNGAQDQWIGVSPPVENFFHDLNQPALLAGNDRWLAYGCGRIFIYDVSHDSWIAPDKMQNINCLEPDATGFWLSGWDGLNHYDPDTRSAEHWPSVSTINSPFGSMMGTPMFGNSQILSRDSDRINERIEGILRNLRSERRKNHAAQRLGGSVTDPLHLESRMPGGITALADDGDYLWMGAGNYFGNYLILLHKSSRSLVAYYLMGPRDAIASLAVTPTSVWVGTAYGDQQLLEFSKRNFLSVPQSHWVSSAISVDERKRLIGGMSVRDQAMYAFYAGDDARVVALLGDRDPDQASLEELFLLAFSYDATGLDQPDQARNWYQTIISRYPDSPWANFARTALSDNEQDHLDNAHREELISRYDRNHDGILDAQEKLAMEKDPAYQAMEQKWNDSQLPGQIQEIFKRFDLNRNGGLDRFELENLRSQVELFAHAPPELLAGHKLLVKPFLGAPFPSVDVLLQQYDTNHEGALDPTELENLARDLQKKK